MEYEAAKRFFDAKKDEKAIWLFALNGIAYAIEKNPDTDYRLFEVYGGKVMWDTLLTESHTLKGISVWLAQNAY